jgi:hypothetical protein
MRGCMGVRAVPTPAARTGVGELVARLALVLYALRSECATQAILRSTVRAQQDGNAIPFSSIVWTQQPCACCRRARTVAIWVAVSATHRQHQTTKTVGITPTPAIGCNYVRALFGRLSVSKGGSSSENPSTAARQYGLRSRQPNPAGRVLHGRRPPASPERRVSTTRRSLPHGAAAEGRLDQFNQSSPPPAARGGGRAG